MAENNLEEEKFKILEINFIDKIAFVKSIKTGIIKKVKIIEEEWKGYYGCHIDRGET
jgi:hypothetical protein